MHPKRMLQTLGITPTRRNLRMIHRVLDRLPADQADPAHVAASLGILNRKETRTALAAHYTGEISPC